MAAPTDTYAVTGMLNAPGLAEGIALTNHGRPTENLTGRRPAPPRMFRAIFWIARFSSSCLAMVLTNSRGNSAGSETRESF